MDADRRNPYLVLGVPYGTDRAAATRAFARRSKLARRGEDLPYSVDDLTWALHQVEARLDDPSSAVEHFRIPADPKAASVPDGAGIFRLAIVPIARRSLTSTSASYEALRSSVRQQLVAQYKQQAAERATKDFILSEPAPAVKLVLSRAERA